MTRPNPISQALLTAVRGGTFPGAVLLVRLKHSILFHEAVGLASTLPSAPVARLDTLYDLASLTKPLAAATGILCLVQDGLIDLNQTVGSILRPLLNSPVGQATIRDLLGHRSGLPAWRPYYKQFPVQQGAWSQPDSVKKRRDFVLDKICHEPLEYQPGSQTLYSDLGFMLLGLVIEDKTNQSLARYCQERIFDPLGAKPLTFLHGEGGGPLRNWAPSDIAPTDHDPWRGRLVQGEVHDENAFLLGGIAGHAGLFGTAEAVAAITGAWVEGYWGRHDFFDRNLVNEFVAKQPGSSWALGWDTPSSPSSSGTRLSDSAFGHLGFTGTSVWIDPISELEIILLSNRVHPTRDNNGIKDFRPTIHDLVYEEFVGKG